MKRAESLKAFEQALFNAFAVMPGGYPGASADRERFVSPIEVVLVALKEEIEIEEDK